MADRKATLKAIRVRNQRAASYDTPDLTGRVRSREPATDLARSSGRNPKAAQAIKDAIRGDDMSATSRGTRANPEASARLSNKRWEKAEILAERSGGRITDARIDRLRRAATRGLLSPAGMAEEVVARVAKHMGADEEPMYEKMRAEKRTRLLKPTRRTY